MSRKLLLVAAVIAVAIVSVTASAAPKAPKRVTISARESFSYKINRYKQDGVRWSKDVYTISSGGTLVFKNTLPDEPHTFSVLKRSQLPHTTKQLTDCNTEPPTLPKYGPCRALFIAHAPTGQGPPKNPVLNQGKPGIDVPGDSLFIPPKGAPQPSIKVTAKPGTTLYFFCLVHPWMQGKLIVK